MVRSVLILVACLAGTEAARPCPAPKLPCDWRMVDGAVASDKPIRLLFALKQQNHDELHRVARDVSNPRSGRYGQHLSQSQLWELTAPPSEHVATVRTWLERSGAQTQVLGLGSVLEASLSIGAASALLRTTFRDHANAATGQRALRASDYVLPLEVEALLAAVYGLHGLPLPLRADPRAGDDILAITPDLIHQTYGVSGIAPSGSKENRQAVVEFQQKQQMNSTDLKSFFESYVPGTPDVQKAVHEFVGDIGDGKAGGEAALDIEYIMGVAPGVLTDFYYYQSNDFCADLIQWTSGILDDVSPPLVHSASYGYQGDLSRLGCTDEQISNVDSNFAKLAARGITVIISSGDSGSGYSIDCGDDQQVNDTEVTDGTVSQRIPVLVPIPTFCCAQAAGSAAWTYKTGGLWPTCTLYSEVRATGPSTGGTTGGPAVVKDFVPKLWPEWPTSSPWVTSVGGTRLDQQQAGRPEIAVDQFGSGGGFSATFEAFKDQKAFTAAYLAQAPQLPPTGSFPPEGRGTPDVSALGEGYQTLINGKLVSVGGTSAAAPAFAALISLINEARLAAGKPAMGYLNPFLYQNPDAFTDVTVGTNAVDRTGSPLLYGYNCTKGWDPVTGLGTPKFGKLLEAALAAAGTVTIV